MLDMKPQEQNPKLLSPLTLAFLGDAVYELCVRQRVVAEGNRPVNDHAPQGGEARQRGGQSGRVRAHLRRAHRGGARRLQARRNANATSSPKHAALADYRRATGVEALFGYLYLKGETERIGELFDLACAAAEG